MKVTQVTESSTFAHCNTNKWGEQPTLTPSLLDLSYKIPMKNAWTSSLANEGPNSRASQNHGHDHY
jgi:hypothetical protein